MFADGFIYQAHNQAHKSRRKPGAQKPGLKTPCLLLYISREGVIDQIRKTRENAEKK